MNKSNIDYEILIRNSILFSLDRHTQATAFRREALKLVEYLYLYLNSFNLDKYKEFGLEITETANRCIKNYTSETGDFLNYFNAAISKEYRKAYARKHLAEQHCGVHIPENDKRIIRKYIKYAEVRGSYELDSEVVDAIVFATSIAKEKIIDCVTHYYLSFSKSDTYTKEEGTEGSLFDLLPSVLNSTEDLNQSEDAKDFLKHINEIYRTRQARQKILLARMLTAKIAFRLMEDTTLLRYAQTLEFFDESIYLDSCVRKSPISAREIGTSLGISEQSVSRTYKGFISLI